MEIITFSFVYTVKEVYGGLVNGFQNEFKAVALFNRCKNAC